MVWLSVILVFVFGGCQQKSAERHYTEVVVQAPEVPAAAHDHASMDTSADPHAGMDMSSMAGPMMAAQVSASDPHAGLDLNALQAGLPKDDPHSGMDMSNMGNMMGIAAEAGPRTLDWQLPKGWIEDASGSQMRMATFRLESDPKAMDCSIVPLAGDAGGLEANLSRWIGQVGLESSKENLEAVMKSAKNMNTKDRMAVKVYDLGVLQAKAGPSDQSMIVAIFTMEKSSIFVKLTGSLKVVTEQKNNLLKLIDTLHRK